MLRIGMWWRKKQREFRWLSHRTQVMELVPVVELEFEEFVGFLVLECDYTEDFGVMGVGCHCGGRQTRRESDKRRLKSRTFNCVFSGNC